MTAEQVRALVRGRLKLWGVLMAIRDGLQANLAEWCEIQRGGFWPSGDGIRSGNKPDSRMPAPAWFFELSLAFAKLNPGGPGPASNGRFTALARKRFNARQRVLILSFDPAFTGPAYAKHKLDLTAARKTFFEHERERAEKAAFSKRRWRLDDEIAKVLGISSRAVFDHRKDALSALTALMPDDVADVA